MLICLTRNGNFRCALCEGKLTCRTKGGRAVSISCEACEREMQFDPKFKSITFRAMRGILPPKGSNGEEK